MYSAKRKIQNLLHNATSKNPSPAALPLSSSSTSVNKITKTTTATTTAPPTTNTTTTTANIATTTMTTTLGVDIDEEARKRRKLSSSSAVRSNTVSRPGTPSSRPSTAGTMTSADPMPPNSVTKVDAAKYAPWDRNKFLERLSTFRSVSNWSTKPAKVNEVEWAKRGWVCIGGEKNRVRCSGRCGGELKVEIDDKFELLDDEENADDGDEGADRRSTTEKIKDHEEKVEMLVQKYRELIIEGHSANCLWKKKGCDSAIYRLPLQPATVSREAFRTRYDTLLTLSPESIPSNIVTPFEIDMDTILLPDDVPKPTFFKEAVVLATFGWSREDTGGAIEMVKCDACFRRLGLWLFMKPSLKFEDDDDSSSMTRLNVVEEHRDYCPWVNAESQAAQHPGWQILLKILQNPIPGNLVAAPSLRKPKTPGPLEKKSEEEQRKDDESRWNRLKNLRKVYGSGFLSGKSKDKSKSSASGSNSTST